MKGKKKRAPPPLRSEKAPPSRAPIQVFRILSLVVPSALAWEVTFSAEQPTRLIEAVKYALGPLWILVAAALLFRCVDALRKRARSPEAGAGTLLDQIDVLTASGSSLVWLGAGAIMASVWIGWASLAVVGLMGLGLVQIMVVWTQLVAGGTDPWRRASVSRRFVPENAAEGAQVIEELSFDGTRIPLGFRLFAAGRVGPRWPTSRYVVSGAESGGEVVLESDVSPALRGDHQAEPMEIWLQDVLGLCRTARVRAAEAKLTVVPRPRPVDGAAALLGKSGSDRLPRPTVNLPTEGSLRLREYQPGDDARRIHWVRSLTSREIVVRLPDERSPDQPAVKLVLDTFLPGTEGLTCAAPSELLDALVEVWLGVGRALVESGARVTLVTAAARGDAMVPARQHLGARADGPALRLGAQVRWQETLPVEALLGKEATIVVSCRRAPLLADHGPVRWILVPEAVWTLVAQPKVRAGVTTLPHPMGSADNRWSRRRRERLRSERARRDQSRFVRLCEDCNLERAGSFVARPAARARIRLEALHEGAAQ